MKYYRLRNKEINWGDYGDILLSGMTAHLERDGNLLQLERTGPFQPAIILSGYEDLLVTDTLKNKIESDQVSRLDFLPVVRKHIVFLDWTNWDLKADEPKFYPENGDPENYILGMPHSPEVASSMEKVWEVVVPHNGKFTDSLSFIPGEKNIELMKAENSGWFIATEKMKNWLETNNSEWLNFEEVNVESKLSK